jgi:hypothetical protein
MIVGGQQMQLGHLKVIAICVKCHNRNMLRREALMTRAKIASLYEMIG